MTFSFARNSLFCHIRAPHQYRNIMWTLHDRSWGSQYSHISVPECVYPNLASFCNYIRHAQPFFLNKFFFKQMRTKKSSIECRNRAKYSQSSYGLVWSLVGIVYLLYGLVWSLVCSLSTLWLVWSLAGIVYLLYGLVWSLVCIVYLLCGLVWSLAGIVYLLCGLVTVIVYLTIWTSIIISHLELVNW